MVTKVVALRDGFYGGKIRKAGTKFNVDLDRHVSTKWMAEVGSAKYRDFMRGIDADKNQRDGITGERLSAGGLAEQLSVALEENRRLEQKAGELEAELEIMRRGGPVTRDKVETVTPAEEEKAAEEETSKPVRRRRRKEEGQENGSN